LRKLSIDTIHRIEKVTHLEKKRSYKVKWWIPLIYLTVLIVIILLTTILFEAKKQYSALKIFQKGKYLVLFQNNAEMRPTGGFLGSFAVAQFDQFNLKKIDFNSNIYKIDNEFAKTNLIAAPDPINTINDNKWTMHDSNFAVDFPAAARQIQWFYEQETGDYVDGTIALNASTFQELLKITGPIALTEYNTTVNAENFFSELAQKIEKEYFQTKDNQVENEPKEILKSLMPQLLKKALETNKIALVKLIYQELSQKQILFYANEARLEKNIIHQGWAGEVKLAESDYLYINNANLTDLRNNRNAGAKTSLSIDESIDYQVTHKIGGWQGNLTLTRAHTGSYTWPDGVNMNWTRILVPLGSNLQSATLNGKEVLSEIKTNEESGKTVFGLWINTAPQNTSILKLQYTIPIKTQKYSLIIQKQPGNLGDQLKVKLNDRQLFNGLFDRDHLIQ